MPPVPKPQKRPRKRRKQQNSKGDYGKRIPDYRRREVVNRDFGICQYCGKFTNLEGIGLHHIIYRSHANRDRVHDLCNLITLCTKCHRKIHDEGNEDIRQFTINWAVSRYGTRALENVLKPKKGVSQWTTLVQPAQANGQPAETVVVKTFAENSKGGGSMFPAEIMARLEILNTELPTKTEELKKLGQDKAKAEREYRLNLTKKILELKESKYSISLINELAKGDELIASLRMERDIKETLFDACKEAIKNIRGEIETLRSFLAWQKEELKNA